MARVLFGILLGILIVPVGVGIWLYNGQVPVAVTDPPLPNEEQIMHIPLNARIQKELIQMSPIQPSAQVYIAGAHIYAEKCSVCHGFHGKPSTIGESMYPAAPPLWEKHHSSSVVGVSDDPAGETYWKVANGIRFTGMPEFRSQMTNDELWEVSLLLADADKPLPPAAVSILKGESVPASGTATPADSSEGSSPKVSSDSQ